MNYKKLGKILGKTESPPIPIAHRICAHTADFFKSILLFNLIETASTKSCTKKLIVCIYWALFGILKLKMVSFYVIFSYNFSRGLGDKHE